MQLTAQLHRSMLIVIIALLVGLGGLPVRAADTPAAAPLATSAADCSASWQLIARRRSGIGARAVLDDVVAIAPNNLWAVGHASLLDTRYDEPLIQRWDGAIWQVVPAPAIEGDTVVLSGVAAAGPSALWAVGTTSTYGFDPSHGLLLRGDGSGWVRQALPASVQSISTSLYDVVVLSATSVWAGGSAADGPLALHWDGVSWTRVPVPGGQGQGILKMAAVSATNIWAIGASNGAVLHYNGSNWQVMPGADPDALLFGIAATGPNDVWAVGSKLYQPFGMHWNGMVWQSIPMPQLELGDNNLKDVVALAPNHVWAVGRGTYSSIALHWDGSLWRDASPPRTVSNDEAFAAVDGLSASDIWAVGRVGSEGPMLVRHFAPQVALASTSFARSSATGADISARLTAGVPYTVSVGYSTSDGSALAGIDYTATSGVLAIPPCQSAASFTVPLLDNPIWKPTAFATVQLSNPSGAILTSPSSARFYTGDRSKAPPGRVILLPAATRPPESQPGRIAYVVSTPDNNWDIYTMNANGGDRRRLTTDPARDFSPSWSPDGQQLAFVSERDGNPEIYVMNADGSGQQRLTASPGEDASPAWSPDGQHIAFASARLAPRLLFVMQRDGSNTKQITPRAARATPTDLAPAWSPDGSRLAFASTRDGSTYSEIYVVGVDGRGLQRLTTTNQENLDPVWSPDGQTIAFASGFIPRYQLMRIRPDGSQLGLLSPNFDTGAHPSWSPDGQSVVYDRGSDGISIIGLNNMPPLDLAPQAYREFDPVWSPRRESRGKIMAPSNHERVGRALELLNAGLMPFFERELRAAYGDTWEEEARLSLNERQGGQRDGAR